MYRETSKKAYQMAIDSGLVSRLRLEVFKYVCEFGPVTFNEVMRHFKTPGNTGVYGARMTELNQQGLIEAVGNTTDEETKITVILWDITGNLPLKLKKPITKSAKKTIALEKLRELYQSAHKSNDEFIGVANAIKDI